jgi:hypothetical protein
MLSVVVASAETSEGESCCRVCVAKQVRGSALNHADCIGIRYMCTAKQARDKARGKPATHEVM